MIGTTHTRFTSVRRLALAGALVASFVPVLIGGSPPVAAAPPTELFMSEYIEGSSFNKAIEIYNGTGAAVDLAAGGYTLELYSNGSATASQSVALSGSIADGDVFVLAHGSADPAIQAVADLVSTLVINFNGDDAVVLRKAGAVVDAFGQIGFDPGSQWTGGGQDDTLRRNETICAGDTDPDDAFDASAEWVTFAVNTFDGLGSHTTICGGGSGPADPVINEFSASTAGTDVEYVEVYGAPSTDLSNLTVLEIEGDATSATGTVDEVIRLGTTDLAGFYLASLPANALENGTITLLLVEGFTGTVGDDIDADDNGAIDVTPWARIVDDVAVADGGANDLTYSSTVLGPNYDGVSTFAPGGASRFPDGTDTDAPADWVRNDFDLAGIPGFTGTPTVGEAINTPGAPNEIVVPPPTGFCDDPATLISVIQGSGGASPLIGQTHIVEAVVVGDFQDGAKGTNGDLDGFHLQEEDADADGDPLTSEGIFVFEGPNPAVDVNIGDRVRVVGPISEFFGQTQITATGVLVCDSGNPAPTPATPALPVTAIDDFERFEGMSVTFPQDLVISEYFNFDRFGEIVLTSERRLTPTAEFEPGPDAVAAAGDYLLNRITLDDGRSSQNPDPAIHPNGAEFDLDNLFRGGDTVANVTGVMDYAFGLYRVQPTQGADYTPVNLRTASPDDVGGDVRVASFNVLNYFTTIDDGVNDICGPAGNQECRGADNAEELTRQRDKIVAALTAIDADVVGLIEIENNVDDDAVIDLVASLNAVSGTDTYDYVATGAIGTDAIKVAIIYKPSTVSPVGGYAILDSSVDPRFIDTKSRPVLAQSFADGTGSVFTVAVNHLKSKGSDCNDVGDPDLGDGAGNCNATRTAAAEALVDWLAGDPTGSGDTDTLIIGDLNSYDKEDPIDAIVAGPDDTVGTADDYTDLIRLFQGEDAYSYVFDGQIGYLDHALASTDLLDQVTGTTVWHINADEADLIDYDTSFKRPAQDAIYAPDPYRSSDHDPVVVGLQLDTPRSLKEDARTALSAALPTGDTKVDRFVMDAVERIEQSLEPAWWLDDATLDPTNGNRVFDREHQAVVTLSKVDLPVAGDVIDDLVEADRRLAAVQIEIAVDAGGDPVELARAQQSFTDAAVYATAGRFDKAVLEYKQAWTNAIKALR
jgi:predicted extracellular nuclease